ncbi:MAG: lipopolysaccharide biosynthesis protein [Nocardioidaceae bacterium]
MQSRARDTSALAVGSTINGILAYVFFALTTRAIGSESAAPVSVLWTYWSFAAAAITFPIQHWIARSVAAHGGEGAVRQQLTRVTLSMLGVSAATGALAWLGRGSLFHSQDLWFPLLIATVTIGSVLSGVVRGALTGRRQFVSVAVEFVGENSLRCAAVVAIMVAGATSPVYYGLCLAIGPLVALCWPSALRFSTKAREGHRESSLTFIGGAAGGQLIGQAILTGGPVVLALSGARPHEVTALFAALALFRAPYVLALGLVTQLTGRLTSLVVQNRLADLRRIRLVVLVTTVVASVGAAAIGAVLGPPLLRLIFGPDVTIAGDLALVLAIGSTVALGNLVLTVALLAQNRGGVVARVWTIGLLGGVVCFAAVDTGALARTCLAFLAAEVVAFAASYVEQVRWSSRRVAAATPVG